MSDKKKVPPEKTPAQYTVEEKLQQMLSQGEGIKLSNKKPSLDDYDRNWQ